MDLQRGRIIMRMKRRVTFTITIVNVFALFIPATSAQEQHFITRPSNVTALEGQTATLQCKIGNQAQQGNTQWTKNGFAMGYDYALPGFPGYSVVGQHSQGEYNLQIAQVKLQDDGEYDCQTLPHTHSHEKDFLHSIAFLHVIVPPKTITLEGSSVRNGGSVEVRVNSRVEVTCKAMGGKPAANLRWFKNGNLVETNVDYFEMPEGNKLTTSAAKLSFAAQSFDSQAVFTCQAQHSALPAEAQLKTNFTLFVLYPPGVPSIRGYAEGQTVQAGDVLKLECDAKNGNPNPQLFWYRNNRQIDASFYNQPDDTRNDYEFTVEASDNGAEYRCEAVNTVTPSPLSATVKLKVYFPPSKVVIEGSQSAKVGDLVKLTCSSEASHPPARIHWLVDGKPVLTNYTTSMQHSEQGTVTTSITMVQLGQERRDIAVVCYAMNDQLRDPAQKVATNFLIQVHYPLESIAIYGYDGEPLMAGTTHRLSCVSIGGFPLPQLNWFKGIKKRLNEGQGNVVNVVNTVSGNVAQSELTLLVTAEDNRAQFVCRGANLAMAKPAETSVSLNVHFLPESVAINVSPQLLRVGQTAILSCETSSANPLPVISWWKANERLLSYDVHNKSSSNGGWEAKNRLQVTLSEEDDGSQFTCKAEALDQVKSETRTLSVLYKPKFLLDSPQTISVVEQESVFLNTTAVANPPVLSYKWTRNGESLVSGVSSSLYGDQSRFTANGPILNISNVLRKDAGEYVCEAENSEGTTSMKLIIGIQFGAKIERISEAAIVSIGERAVLECSAVGFPQPDSFVRWQRLNYDMSRVKQTFDKATVRLELPSADRDDAGVFECVADNGVGEPSRKQAVLMVKQSPLIDRSLLYKKAAARRGDSALLLCKVEAVPEAEVHWYRNGNQLITNSTKFYTSTLRTGLTQYQGTLTINNVEDADRLTYECVARNELGSDRHHVMLTKIGPPEEPMNVRLLNVTHDSVTISWSPSFAGGLPQRFKVRVQKLGESSFAYFDVTSGENVFTVTGLSPSTIHSFTVAAYNEAGHSSYAQKSLSAQTTAGDYGVVREDVKGGPLLEIIIGSLTAGIILLILHVAILYYAIKRRNKRKLQEKAATTRLMDPHRQVQMYASTDPSGAVHSASSGHFSAMRRTPNNLDRSSASVAYVEGANGFAAEYADGVDDPRRQNRSPSRLSDEDARSVRTVIEVDASGHPVFVERINPNSYRTFLVEDPACFMQTDSGAGHFNDDDYADSLRSNSLQRKLVAGVYTNNGFNTQDSNRAPVLYGTIVKNGAPSSFHSPGRMHQVVSSNSGTDHQVSSILPLRSISQELTNGPTYANGYANYQSQRPDRNGLIKRYSPENFVAQPFSAAPLSSGLSLSSAFDSSPATFGSNAGSGGHSAASCSPNSVAISTPPNLHSASHSRFAANNCVEVRPTVVSGPYALLCGDRSSPILSTFAPNNASSSTASNSGRGVKTDYVDVNRLEGDLV